MLRNYQIQSIKDFESSIEKNILLSLPTGAGKTYTFCEIAKRFFADHTQKVLILVHRTELLTQIQTNSNLFNFVAPALDPSLSCSRLESIYS